MKKYKTISFCFLLALSLQFVLTGCRVSFSSSTIKKSMKIQGESLVLPSTKPGKLCFDEIGKSTVMVRSDYLPDDSLCKIYREGIDYTVNYRRGEIKRTVNSGIPDYSKHPLYGKKDFDHTLYPEYSNLPYFVYVDYATDKGSQFAEPKNQSKYLVNFRKKLEAGDSVTIVSYGNSIAAGGEASSTDLRFQYRYKKYLEQKFPNASIEIEDVSIPGRTAKEGIDYWDDYIGKTSPDLVLVGWGMNDHCVSGHPPDQFKKHLLILVDMIKERKQAEVVIFSAFPAHEDWHYSERSMEPYAEASKQLAKEAGCAYADVYGTWGMVLQRKDQPSLLANNINHPNDFGHWLYLQAFEAMIF